LPRVAKENSNITILTNREPFQVGSKELNLLSSMNSVISNDDSFLKKRSSISDMILQNPHLFSLILKMQIRMKRFLVNIRSKHPQKSKMEIVDEDETTHMEDSHQQKFETVNESKNEENLSKHYKQENPNFQSVTTLRSLDSINFSFTANPKNRSSLYLVNLRETQLTFASKEGEKMNDNQPSSIPTEDVLNSEELETPVEEYITQPTPSTKKIIKVTKRIIKKGKTNVDEILKTKLADAYDEIKRSLKILYIRMKYNNNHPILKKNF